MDRMKRSRCADKFGDRGGRRTQRGPDCSTSSRNALAVLGVPIHEQVALVAQESIQRIGEIAADLHHPGFGGMAGAAGELHTTGGELRRKQQIESNEPSLGPDLDGGEIDCGQNIPMGFQECMPCGLAFSFRRGFDTVFSEDVSNG